MQFGVNGLKHAKPLQPCLQLVPHCRHVQWNDSTPAVFLTWCRSPGLSLHPSPLWTSLPSSSRWVGWRHRCSRKTPGKSGSKHFLQRHEMTCGHAYLSCWLVKGMRFMCTPQVNILPYHISAYKVSNINRNTCFVICASYTCISAHSCLHLYMHTHIHTQLFLHKIHVKSGCMRERVNWTL